MNQVGTSPKHKKTVNGHPKEIIIAFWTEPYNSNWVNDRRWVLKEGDGVCMNGVDFPGYTADEVRFHLEIEAI